MLADFGLEESYATLHASIKSLTLWSLNCGYFFCDWNVRLFSHRACNYEKPCIIKLYMCLSIVRWITSITYIA